jgi:hypothetical protein
LWALPHTTLILISAADSIMEPVATRRCSPEEDRTMWTGFIAVFSFIATVLVENKKARVASELHRLLSQMSDADLAKIGITRRTIAKHIHDQLYGTAGR